MRITAKMMEQFGCVVDHEGAEYIVPAGSGYYPQTYYIEPDVSAACYFYAAAALTGGTAIVKGVHSNSMQGDLKFIDVLKQMGCAVTEEREGICVSGPKDLSLIHILHTDLRNLLMQERLSVLHTNMLDITDHMLIWTRDNYV